MHNPDFKGREFEAFENAAGRHSFYLSPQKWIEATNAIGIVSKSGNNGGTFAHRDIAFEFASRLSPEFKLYLVTEFQRLKAQEQQALEWSAKRELAKVNYRIHTDAIKENIVPTLTEEQLKYVYADEADLLNVALFGKTAAQWRKENPTLMAIYAIMPRYVPQAERLQRLNDMARSQLRVLQQIDTSRLLDFGDKKN